MSKEKKPFQVRFSMRVFFTIFIVAELLVIYTVAGLLVALLGIFVPAVHRIPEMVWLLIISMVLGSAIARFMFRFFFQPIKDLGQAMGKVTQGNFNVTLDSKHTFPEVCQIYQDFNTMTQELRSIEILKTEFISNVSHEFKTPINAIEGYATLLQGERDEQDREAYIQKILYNTGRLSKLVGNILLLSKVDNQGIRTHDSTYRLDEQIRQCLLALEPKWTQMESEFDVNLEPVMYTGNENLMIHVWSNLMENAIKYGPQGGLISLKLVQRENTITFTIDDEGPGIPQEALPHIFGRFYQADSSRKAEGHGLGLALVKKIVTLSGGTIRAENLPQGGARFTVQLPFRQE